MAEEEAESTYTQITETQERLMIFSIYIVGSMGILLSIQMLYSLSKSFKRLRNRDNNYDYALRFGVTLIIASLLFFLIRLLSNDLILPIHELIAKNIGLVSMIDSIVIILWLIIKISVYFGFTFLYLSMFNKPKIDIWLRILMTFTVLSAIIYMVEYLVDDLLNDNQDEIVISKHRNICMINIILMYSTTSTSIMLTALVAFVTDFIYTLFLLYRFISSAAQTEKAYFDGIKGCVLLCISSIPPIFTAMVVIFELDSQYLMGNIGVLCKTVCLFLMFKENRKTYKNLCGCICDKCCAAVCFGYGYKAIEMRDDEDETDDVSGMDESDESDEDLRDSDEQIDNDPTFML